MHLHVSVYHGINNMENDSIHEEAINACKEIDDLARYIKSIDGIQGSEIFYPSEKIIRGILHAVFYGKDGFIGEYAAVTRSCGLRKKVMALCRCSDEEIDRMCKTNE